MNFRTFNSLRSSIIIKTKSAYIEEIIIKTVFNEIVIANFIKIINLNLILTVNDFLLPKFFKSLKIRKTDIIF